MKLIVCLALKLEDMITMHEVVKFFFVHKKITLTHRRIHHPVKELLYFNRKSIPGKLTELNTSTDFNPLKNGVFILTTKFNLLKPTDYLMHQQFNIQQLYATYSPEFLAPLWRTVG